MDIRRITSLFVTLIAVSLTVYVNIPKIINTQDEETQFLITEHDTLTLLVEKDSPGIFYYSGSYHGLVYDLMCEYALYHNKVIRVEVCNNQLILSERFANDDVAFALVISPLSEIGDSCYFSTALTDSCKYEILGNKRNSKLMNLSHSQLAENARIIYVRGANNFSVFTDKANLFFADTTAPCNHEMINNINLVRLRKYDCVLCKDEEALLYRYLFKSIVAISKIDEYVSSNIIVSSRNMYLFEDFECWYNTFVNSSYYKDIYDNYYYNKYLFSFVTNGYLSPTSSISKYDNLFIDECRNSHFDWRFLSAISSVESKYSPSLKSHKGAIGLMQIMPIVAKKMGVEKSELFDERTNIRCAIALLEDNAKMLNIKSKVLSDDELSILLASYNAGYGQVSDAARLARRYGEDISSWVVIKKYLRKKREYQYYKQKDIVHSGSFISDETEKFVDLVMAKYNEYKNKELRQI